MSRLIDNKRALVALAIVVAFVAIVVPTCRMIGCSMSLGSAGAFGDHGMAGFYGSCGGTYVTSIAPTAIVPAGADALVLALVAAIVAALALALPPLRAESVRVSEHAPPPPPEDPRGERLRL